LPLKGSTEAGSRPSSCALSCILQDRRVGTAEQTCLRRGTYL